MNKNLEKILKRRDKLQRKKFKLNPMFSNKEVSDKDRLKMLEELRFHRILEGYRKLGLNETTRQLLRCKEDVKRLDKMNPKDYYTLIGGYYDLWSMNEISNPDITPKECFKIIYNNNLESLNELRMVLKNWYKLYVVK
jgi:hypothetical protein